MIDVDGMEIKRSPFGHVPNTAKCHRHSSIAMAAIAVMHRMRLIGACFEHVCLLL
jgi:hypothetical protein